MQKYENLFIETKMTPESIHQVNNFLYAISSAFQRI